MNDKEGANQPPAWIQTFLQWFCPDDLIEGILGDLLEQYEDNIKEYGIRKSNMTFIWQVIRLFHPSIILRNKFQFKFFPMEILVSYLKVAFRSMKKYLFYSTINILGLTLAIAFVFLVFRFIESETAYDHFHEHKDRIYRLYHRTVSKESGAIKDESAVTAIPLAKDLSDEVPAIEDFTRVASANATIYVNENIFEEKITYVDAGFFKMFDFPILEGRPFDKDQEKLILVEREQAIKLFGRENPVGKTIQIGINQEKKAFTICGVIDNQYGRSSLDFQFLVPMHIFREIVGEDTYTSYNYGMVENYLLTRDNENRSGLSGALNAAIRNKTEDEHFLMEVGLQPLISIHFEDQIAGNARYTNPRKLYIMGGLAVLVLFIALINFIILSTSQSLHRAKEMGLRSTLGAKKSQIRRQMVIESFFLVLLSCFIGIILTIFVTPGFSKLIDSEMTWNLGVNEILLLVGLCLIIGFINGNLQSLFLIRSNAIHSLRSNLVPTFKNSLLNRSLLVVQFTFSIILLISALGMRYQMQYVSQKDLGFDQDRLLEINLNGVNSQEESLQLIARFRNKALSAPDILSVSASMNNAREPWTQLAFEQTGGKPENIFFNQIDPEYLETMGIELKYGHNFRKDAGASPQNAILVNEALARHFNWKDPLVEQIPGAQFSESHQIIGVVKDFHFSNLRQKIEPLILAQNIAPIASGITGLSTYVWPANLYTLLVRVGPGNLSEIIKDVENIWTDVSPDRAFVYHFMDQTIDSLYADDQRWSRLIDLATLFAVIISWMGLLGLMRLTLQKRTKEIGIRRVLGASMHGLIGLLTRQYLILILLGSFIAIPSAFYLLWRWLNNFSYRIDLNPLLFILAGLAVILFSFISLALQSLSTVKTAIDKSLKDE
ncbi:MAG: ABC transporter permease [Saprospiraceae bacterium]|nr:ABC transporter permease [Saprospiraceae bacterium]